MTSPVTYSPSADRAKSAGQRAYEAELQARPNYHDSTPRKPWAALCDVARWSWERNPTPRWSL